MTSSVPACTTSNYSIIVPTSHAQHGLHQQDRDPTVHDIQIRHFPAASRLEAPYVIYKRIHGAFVPYAGLAMAPTVPIFNTHEIYDYDVLGDWIFILCNHGIVRKFPLTLNTTRYHSFIRYGDRYVMPVHPARGYATSVPVFVSRDPYSLPSMYIVSDPIEYDAQFRDLHFITPHDPTISTSVFPRDSLTISVTTSDYDPYPHTYSLNDALLPELYYIRQVADPTPADLPVTITCESPTKSISYRTHAVQSIPTYSEVFT